MATISGVWVWNDVFDSEFGNSNANINTANNADYYTVNFLSNGVEYTSIGFVYTWFDQDDDDNDDGKLGRIYYRNASTTISACSVWVGDNASWPSYNTFYQAGYKTIDFGTTEQTVSDTFYTYLTANATQQAPSVPTPDWANCFVKTASGNKAVEKVWIKQNGQLKVVWDSGGGGGAAVNFATDSWETISAACKDGSYKTVYQVGDTKDIELSTGETITVAIMGFDHDDLSDGSGKAPITVAMENLLATTYPMNSSQTNVGGWDESKMRTSTMATLLSQLPSDLQGVIKQVNKKATAGGASTGITTSADKLWLLAEVEVDGTTTAGYADEGEQYEYWKTVKDGTVPADRIKYLSNGSGSASIWWLRSTYEAAYFRSFFVSGNVTDCLANGAYGVCFCFCVG